MSMGRMVGSLLGAFGGRALGGMLGGNTGRMIGSFAGSMLGSRGIGGMGRGGGGLGSITDLFGGDNDKAEAAGAQIADDDAEILIRAMCNAAKADGSVDDSEVHNIMSRLGDLTRDEEAFLRHELSSPLDLAGFIPTVPSGMENEVYTMSVLAIDVDTGAEADYLAQLASGLNIDNDTRSKIHEALGV